MDGIHLLVFSRELEKNYRLYHYPRRKYSVSDFLMGIQMESICWYISESLKKNASYATITDGNFRRHISSGKFF
jgi:hypothetical protein